MLPIAHGGIVMQCSLDAWANGKLAEIADVMGMKVPSMGRVAKGPALLARVYNNQWIVDCPDCGGAEFMWPDKLLFMCANCWNGTVGHQWRRVVLPADQAQIESVLQARPIPANRNWFPHETIQDLEQENTKRGLPKRWQSPVHERGWPQ